ncbi:MAG: hypothetical protein U0892_10030 [Pirellulales bacterium]
MRSVIFSLIVFVYAGLAAHATDFAARGPTEPKPLDPSQFLSAVTVTFDLHPTNNDVV